MLILANHVNFTGWIRKAKKYYEMMGVCNEGRVKTVVMYVAERASIGGKKNILV